MEKECQVFINPVSELCQATTGSTGMMLLCGQKGYLSTCCLSICNLQLSTDIHHVSGALVKSFQGQNSKVKQDHDQTTGLLISGL